MEAKFQLIYIAAAVVLCTICLSGWFALENKQRDMLKLLEDKCNEERVVMEKR